MKNIFTLVFIMMCGISVHAQSDVGFTHFNFNKLPYNPAYAGSKETLDMTAIYRNQWIGIDGAPVSVTASAHSPFFNRRAGFGINIMSDHIGKINAQNVDLSYAYRMPTGKDKTLSIGVSAGAELASVNWLEADPTQLGDGTIPTNDESYVNPQFGVGVYYLTPKWFAGVSVPSLLNTRYLNFDDQIGIEDNRTIYGMVGLMTRLSDNIQFKPTAMISYNAGAPMEIDLNANFLFLDKFWLGASYRLQDSFDALVQFEVSQRLKMGMSFDFTTSELQKFSKGSVEFMIGYTFSCEDCNIHSIRYF